VTVDQRRTAWRSNVRDRPPWRALRWVRTNADPVDRYSTPIAVQIATIPISVRFSKRSHISSLDGFGLNRISLDALPGPRKLLSKFYHQK
jgi:hypothetical protein